MTLLARPQDPVRNGVRLTKLMLRLEEKHQKQFPELLVDAVNTEGFTKTVKSFGVSKATLNYWLMKYGYQCRLVCVRRGRVYDVKEYDDGGYVVVREKVTA